MKGNKNSQIKFKSFSFEIHMKRFSFPELLSPYGVLSPGEV